MDGIVVGGGGGGREGGREGGEGGEEGWEWEWEWSCVVPREGGERGREGEGVCLYEGGDVVEMPGRGEGRMVRGGEGKRFEKGVPYLFVVKMRVVGGEGRVISEGFWERVYSVVEEEGVSVEEERWVCGDGGFGYLVRFFFFIYIYIYIYFFLILIFLSYG